jgi:hypothetical protein
MSNLPERADPHQLRVSDADREQAAEVLRKAAGEGRITFDELDERLAAAYSAKTYGDLAAVTHDLPEPGPVPPADVAPSPGPATRIGGTPGPAVSVAVMSEAHRTGPWVVPPAYSAVAIMGAIRLDLRDARFSQPEVTIQTFTLMGGVDIIVDEDVEVDVAGFGFMGTFDHRAAGPGLPGAPRVRIVGFALMGGVNVKRSPSTQRRSGRLDPELGGTADSGPPPLGGTADRPPPLG